MGQPLHFCQSLKEFSKIFPSLKNINHTSTENKLLNAGRLQQHFFYFPSHAHAYRTKKRKVLKLFGFEITNDLPLK